MTNILSSDILIIDANIRLSENPAMQALVKKYNLKPGGKAAINKEQFDEFSKAMQDSPVTFTPGGSSANTLTTLSKLLDNEVNVHFYGVTGQSSYSKMIQGGLEEAKIQLLPEKLPLEPRPESAISFVLVGDDGQRTIVTYPGNARDILSPEQITDEQVRRSDVLFVQGSLWQKLNTDFADRLLKLRWDNRKDLWLALPTHAKFGEEQAGLFQWLVPSANLVMGNDEELARIYQTTPDKALEKLQATFREHTVLRTENRLKRSQVGFITMGEHGAAVVTAYEILHIDPIKINASEIKNTVGAGDTAFAGFALGYLKGLPDETSAKMAMALAGEKLKINQARLPDPRGVLKQVMPKLHDELFPAVKSAHAQSSAVGK